MTSPVRHNSRPCVDRHMFPVCKHLSLRRLPNCHTHRGCKYKLQTNTAVNSLKYHNVATTYDSSFIRLKNLFLQHDKGQNKYRILVHFKT